MSFRLRSLFPLSASLVTLAAAPCWMSSLAWSATAPGPTLEPTLRTYLETHCIKCHDADTEKGDFRVDNLSPKIGIEDTPQWLEIMERINSGEMPPKKKPRPEAGEALAVSSWIAQKQDATTKAPTGAGGRVPMRRISTQRA